MFWHGAEAVFLRFAAEQHDETSPLAIQGLLRRIAPPPLSRETKTSEAFVLPVPHCYLHMNTAECR